MHIPCPDPQLVSLLGGGAAQNRGQLRESLPRYRLGGLNLRSKFGCLALDALVLNTGD